MSGDRLAEVEKLRASWRKNAIFADALNKALESIGFDGDFAGQTRPPMGKRKYLKDSIWGMVVFDHACVQLIDSPLIQRLRGIRQLGFSNLVYPSAEHTRFVHTLGMAHVVSRFLSAIEENAGNVIEDPLPQVLGYRGLLELAPLTRQEIVFAALLHDVGHMPFSHASEAALANQDRLFTFGGLALTEVLATARRAFAKEISLSEILSIAIVLSERFETFYKQLAPAAAADDESLLRIACLIAGVQATPACPNIQEIISAHAVDADKIDYVARDAAACGISVGVDVSRIFMGSSLLLAKRSAYDDTYEGEATGIVFVVNSSGADTLDEIVQARSALYQRVYLHPVTRTAEAILARALHLNARLNYKGKLPNLIDALGMWSLDDGSLLSILRQHSELEIAALAERLYLRRLPKKACALAGPLATIATPLGDIFPRLGATAESSIRKDLANTFLEGLKRRGVAHIGILDIEKRIADEATSLADALKARGEGALVPAAPLQLVMVTPIAAMDASRPDSLVFQNGELIRTPEMTNVQGQQDAQDIFKAVGFVFSDPDWRALVLAASRTVILKLSEETAPALVERRITNGGEPFDVPAKRRTILDLEGVLRRANISRKRVERTMKGAAEVGYFDRLPELFIQTAADDPAVTKLAGHFRAFDGDNGWAVNAGGIAAFVDQFPPRLRDDMLAMLAKGTILNQATMRAALISAINQCGTHGTRVACPLSASSGGQAVAIIKNAGIEGLTFAANLGEALDRTDAETIILVDDNSASGVQASAQLYAFCGVAKDKRPLRFAGEDGLFEDGLNEERSGALKSRQTAIAVAAGLPGGAHTVLQTASDLGLQGFAGLVYGQEIAAGLDWPNDLKVYLEAVGRDLMAHRYGGGAFADLEPGPVRERCEARAFGYGGHGGIMTTTSNVPSSTVTALWLPGIAEGRVWRPLFIRRGMLNRFVIN